MKTIEILYFSFHALNKEKIFYVAIPAHMYIYIRVCIHIYMYTHMYILTFEKKLYLRMHSINYF